ncbi:MAG: tetratricopeptide repeat protein [Planctomycetaceae bacterium]|nr:tetratricopeptide repeat protein [Planctomycetaceae bacterium]
MNPHANHTATAYARRMAGPLLIAVAVLAAYSSGLSGPFVLDDLPVIVEDPAVEHGAPPSFWLSHPRGIGVYSFRVQRWMNASLPALHGVNVLIHLLNAWLLYGIVRRTLTVPRLNAAFASQAANLALAVALVWSLHPLATQAVTYLVQRFESLATLFYLLAIYGCIRGITEHRGWWCLSLAAIALGLRTKEIVVTAPFVLLWWDRAFAAASWRDVWSRKACYAGVIAVTGVGLWPWFGALHERLWPQLVSTEGQHLRADVDNEATELVIKDVSPYDYLASQPGVILHYLRLAALPVGLCFDYEWPVAREWRAIAGPGAIVGAMVLATLAGVWFGPRASFLAGCYFLVLAPTSTIVPIRDLCVEHRMYLPLAAVVTAAVIAIYNGLVKPRPWTRQAIAGRALIAVCIVFGGLTFLRNRDYATDVALWHDTVVKAPHNARAHYNYARTLVALPQPTQAQAMEAKQHFEWVIEHRPPAPRAHNSLGLLLLRLGDAAGAREQFAIAARLRPDFMVTHNNLGILYAREGKLSEAIEAYRKALALNPDYAEAHNNLAIALSRSGDNATAIEHLREALRLEPDYPAAQKNLQTIEKQATAP